MWYFDSGASHHVCHSKQSFLTYKPVRDGTALVVGNNSRVDVVGMGTMSLITPANFQIQLKQVYHVPGMIKNLVSLSRLLADHQFKARFDASSCTLEHVSDPRQQVQDSLSESLYHLNAKAASQVALVTTHAQQGAVDHATLWHARLAHVHESKLLSLHKQNLFRHSIPQFPSLAFCDACARGKSKQSAYSKKSSFRAADRLELIHTDLCGPVSAQSFGGALYFIPFIDDYSRMCFVYFLRHKSQALETFLLFLEMAERQSGNKLRTLRTDGGGEFTSHAFQDYCAKRGIVRQVTATYSSSMNGVAEIRHQMLQYQARTMLIQAGLSIGYWAEVINTANYVLNRLPTSSVQGKTPYESWTGRKPSLKHLRVFGAPTYVHVHEAKRSSKFDERSEKMVLVGYMDKLQAYKLLHPQNHKAVYSRHVIVHEQAVLQPTIRMDQSLASVQSHTDTTQLSTYDSLGDDDSQLTSVHETITHSSVDDPSTSPLQFGTVPPPVESLTSPATIATPESEGAEALDSLQDPTDDTGPPDSDVSEGMQLDLDSHEAEHSRTSTPPPTRQLRPRGAGRGS